MRSEGFYALLFHKADNFFAVITFVICNEQYFELRYVFFGNDEHTAALDPATAEKVLEITRRTVAENHITTLMVTHNMHQALELGNRTLMMDSGHIILDVSGAERSGMTVDDLLAKFKSGAGKALDNDRILLSE